MNERARDWTLGLAALGLTLALLALLLVAPQLVRAGELKVGPGQIYTTIQAAHDAAAPGDTILVQAGTYAKFEITKSVTLLGGWNATFTSRTPRKSIIDGSMVLAGSAGVDGDARPPVLIQYPVGTAIQSNFVGSGIEVVIDGFEIKNGSAANGGGIFVQVEDDSKVVINDNLIHHNTATAAGGNGGGIWADLDNRSTLEITNNDIMTNTADDEGGGIYADVVMSGTLILTHNDIVSNTADSKGGFDIALETHGQFQVEDNVVMSNTATSGDSGGLYFDAIYTCQGTFDRNKVEGNEASGQYGGGYVGIEYNSYSTFAGNEFVGNIAGSENGGFYLYVYYNSHVTGDGLKVEDNEAGTSYGGGEVYVEYGGSATLPNMRIAGNQAADDYGGVYF